MLSTCKILKGGMPGFFRYGASGTLTGVWEWAEIQKKQAQNSDQHSLHEGFFYKNKAKYGMPGSGDGHIKPKIEKRPKTISFVAL